MIKFQFFNQKIIVSNRRIIRSIANKVAWNFPRVFAPRKGLLKVWKGAYEIARARVWMGEWPPGFIHPRRARNPRNRDRIGERTCSISRTTLLYAWAVMAGVTRPEVPIMIKRVGARPRSPFARSFINSTLTARAPARTCACLSVALALHLVARWSVSFSLPKRLVCQTRSSQKNRRIYRQNRDEPC